MKSPIIVSFLPGYNKSYILRKPGSDKLIKYVRSDADVRQSDQSYLLCVGLSVTLCNTLPESCC